jgi:hypothetical protein
MLCHHREQDKKRLEFIPLEVTEARTNSRALPYILFLEF